MPFSAINFFASFKISACGVGDAAIVSFEAASAVSPLSFVVSAVVSLAVSAFVSAAFVSFPEFPQPVIAATLSAALKNNAIPFFISFLPFLNPFFILIWIILYIILGYFIIFNIYYMRIFRSRRNRTAPEQSCHPA